MRILRRAVGSALALLAVGLAGCSSGAGLTGNVDGFPQGGAAYSPAGWTRNELGLLTARMALVTAVSYTEVGDYDTSGLFQYFLGGYTPTLRGRFAGRQYLAHFIGRAQEARHWLPFGGVPGTYEVDEAVWGGDYWATGTTVITDLGGGEVHVIENLQITGPGEADYQITTEIRHGANYSVSQRVLGSEWFGQYLDSYRLHVNYAELADGRFSGSQASGYLQTDDEGVEWLQLVDELEHEGIVSAGGWEAEIGGRSTLSARPSDGEQFFWTRSEGDLQISGGSGPMEVLGRLSAVASNGFQTVIEALANQAIRGRVVDASGREVATLGSSDDGDWFIRYTDGSGSEEICGCWDRLLALLGWTGS